MNKTYGIYDMTTGRINRIVSCWPSDLNGNIRPGEGADFFDGVQSKSYRDLVNDIWRDKTQSAVSVSNMSPSVNDDIYITGIPIPCKFRVDASYYDVDDSDLALSFTEPGLHTLYIDAAEHFLEEIEINVTA